MRPAVKLFLLFAAAFCCTPCFGQKPFDAARDPDQDLAVAEAKAAAEHKYVFLDFGANWCGPCLLLDRSLQEDPRLKSKLEENFVVVHVYVGGLFANKRAANLQAHYPRFKSYPHVIIVSEKGALIHDQVSGDFLTNDDGKGLSHKVMAEFLDRWSPKAATPPSF